MATGVKAFGKDNLTRAIHDCDLSSTREARPERSSVMYVAYYKQSEAVRSGEHNEVWESFAIKLYRNKKYTNGRFESAERRSRLIWNTVERNVLELTHTEFLKDCVVGLASSLAEALSNWLVRGAQVDIICSISARNT